MGVSRYSNDSLIKLGKLRSTARATNIIRSGVAQNLIPTTTYVMRVGERLDTIAGQVYGDASYWWIIAAASGIGYPLQVVAGTVVNIPNKLQDVLNVVG